jgi:hypothetical protein
VQDNDLALRPAYQRQSVHDRDMLGAGLHRRLRTGHLRLVEPHDRRMPPGVTQPVQRRGPHPRLWIRDPPQLPLLAQRSHESVLDRVLGLGRIPADRVHLNDQAAVRRVVQMVQLEIATHAALLGPTPPVAHSDVERLTHTNRERGIRFSVTSWSWNMTMQSPGRSRLAPSPPPPG